jgi:hypothetical protein
VLSSTPKDIRIPDYFVVCVKAAEEGQVGPKHVVITIFIIYIILMKVW